MYQPTTPLPALSKTLEVFDLHESKWVFLPVFKQKVVVLAHDALSFSRDVVFRDDDVTDAFLKPASVEVARYVTVVWNKCNILLIHINGLGQFLNVK